MENVKKLFTLFILLISSAILFNHQSFSKKLTERHFVDYQNEEDNHNLQNNDEDKTEIVDDDDEDIGDITAEEEQKDAFLMLKVIFLLVFGILILFSIFLWICLLNYSDADDEKKRGIWKFSQSLEDKHNINIFSIPNEGDEFPKNNKRAVFNEDYLTRKKNLFINRDYKFYKKINGFLDSAKFHENDKDFFYFYLLRFIVPEYSDQRGFPCFYEKRNGDLEFGHSLINNERNKLYQMTENKGDLFEKMSASIEKNESFLDYFLSKLIGFLRLNSYLNFFEDKVVSEINNKIGEINAYIFHYLECYSSYDKNLLTQEAGTIQEKINGESQNKDVDNDEIKKIFFKNTYGKKIESDIEKLIYFLFCRCFMNIIMQKKFSLDALANLCSILEKDGNDNKCYSFKLIPRASSISKDHRENFLGKKNDENMYYVIEISAGKICKYLSIMIKFISMFLNIPKQNGNE